MRKPSISIRCVTGKFALQAPWSTFPRAAWTGASAPSLASTSGLPTSPAWMMGSQPASAASACGRSRPWVSEIAPMVRLMPDQTGMSSRSWWRHDARADCLPPNAVGQDVIFRVIVFRRQSGDRFRNAGPIRKSLHRSLVRIHPIDDLAVGLQITHEDGPARLDGVDIRRHEARSLISQFGNVARAHDLPDLSVP